MRRYNQSPKGRARKALYRERHRTEIRVADVERVRRSRAYLRGQLNIIKMASGCVDCGYNEDPRALDFDHVDGHKVAGLSVMAHERAAWVRIEAELRKCVVRCANCHRIKTTSDEYGGAKTVLAPKQPDNTLF